jgi:hypothetical protein
VLFLLNHTDASDLRLFDEQTMNFPSCSAPAQNPCRKTASFAPQPAKKRAVFGSLAVNVLVL